MKLAHRAGDIDEQIKEMHRETSRGGSLCRAKLKKAGLWNGELDQLPGLALPLEETVRLYRNRFAEHEDDLRQLRQERRKAEATLAASRADLGEVAYGGRIPSEEDLLQLREKRRQGWQLLRRRWLGSEDVTAEAERFAPGLPLHKAYEEYVEQADRVADRLRSEADRVAKAAALTARIESMETAIRELEEQEENQVKRINELDAQWREEWRPLAITPRSPAEMEVWLRDMEALRSLVNDLITREQEAAAKEEEREKLAAHLAGELELLREEAGVESRELAPLVIYAEGVAERLARQRNEREKLAIRQAQLEKALDRARHDQQQAEEALAEWERQWRKAAAGMEFGEQMMPGEALELLETLAECFDKLDRADDFRKRIDGIDRDGKKFVDDVRRIVTPAAPGLKDLPPEQAALQLHSMAGSERQAEELRNRLTREADGLRREIDGGEKHVQSLNERMEGLLATAGCSRVSELGPAMEKSTEYQRLQEKISDAEASLAQTGEGFTAADIKRQAAEIDVDELPGRIASLRREIDQQIYPQIKAVSQKIGEEKKELQLMDGRAEAAEAAERMTRVAARIQRLADQYTRIKVAVTVLRGEIERYREEHQEPILQIASRYFTDLTRGSFAGLRTDVDEKGEPVLVGMRPHGLRLAVQGMSSGTRDQLYLALRLATLEWRLQSGDPMPFIVDDILINFDDDRSLATLEVLAGLGCRNQVILFTHHRRIVDQGTTLKNGRPVHVHEL